VVLIHSPRLTYPQPSTLLLQMPIFGPFSVHSVRLREPVVCPPGTVPWSKTLDAS